MKGVILTGGKGSRLRPFTYSGAKQLVPIANTPVLHFPVRQLVEAGITDIALVVGETHDQIRAAMGDGSAFGARFTYVPQDAPRGIAHGLGICRGFAAGEPVVLYLGDNVLLGGIREFVDTFVASGAVGAVVLKEVEDPRQFGVAVLESGRLQRVVEKPADPPSSLAVIGVYAFRPDVFDVIANLTPSARGELEIADAITALLARGMTVDATVTQDYWIDTGKMEDMLAANRAVLDTLGDAANGAEVIPPCAIAPGVVIENSRVGPYVSLGAGCVIRNSSIANAIVMDQTVVEDCPGIRDSMVGRFAHVSAAPEGSRLILGDHSRFEGPA